MKNENLLRVALRYHAMYLDVKREDIDLSSTITLPTLAFVTRLKRNGNLVTEELLHALNMVDTDVLNDMTTVFDDVMSTKLNWAPLVKNWDIPTGESLADHYATLFANIYGHLSNFKGTTLPCGHLIPEDTFPIERYNGCPFCGTPFETTDYVYTGQGSKQRLLKLYTRDDLHKIFISLLQSSAPLDATQADSLSRLLEEFELPSDISIGMKETAMLVVKTLVCCGRADEAGALMKTPTDILRYLWYGVTGQVKIIEPKTLINHAYRLYHHIFGPLDSSEDAAMNMKRKLSLKYSRKECSIVASWMNALPMSAEQAAETMNPKRGMWVRMIHALRLGEYSRRKGNEHLAEILDVFYKKKYIVWQGEVEKAREANDEDKTLALLKQRPGLFARCLFSTMLRFNADKVIDAFKEVSDNVPIRLLYSLANNADMYFDINQHMLARPITGGTYLLNPHKSLSLYSEDNRFKMVEMVHELYKTVLSKRFAANETDHKTMYIDPMLFNIPVNVGDRATTIQDTSCAMQGTRFPVEGDSVRLFLHWGEGLPAQEMDMDLSCNIAYDDYINQCAYFNLSPTGAKHSGDIRSIPDKVGTAEYIELDIPTLKENGARYVTFTCNAYSTGRLSPNLKVGWMNSAYPMKIDEEKGVAYDPSCVQHMVRISEANLSKGLVFGVLDVKKSEILWLEMPFMGQTIRECSKNDVEALVKKLNSKISIGEVLKLKAEAQHLQIVDTEQNADEVYTYQWALTNSVLELGL